LLDPSVSGSVIVGRPSPQELVGLDRATGAERWRRQLEDEDDIIPISNSGLLILLPAPSHGAQPQPTTMVTAVTAVIPTTAVVSAAVVCATVVAITPTAAIWAAMKSRAASSSDSDD